jgi:uncharacterized membrane protein
MKLKKLVKKGGVADIVTLMIIVGLVVALIIAVVLPMVKTAEGTGDDNDDKLDAIDSFTNDIDGDYYADGTITIPAD